MLTTLPLITEPQHQLLRETISRIVEAARPEKIICYGMRTSTNHAWSCFVAEDNIVTSTAYDLLVITTEKEKSKRDAVARAIDLHDHANAHIKFNSVVHSAKAVENALKEGHFFFTSLWQKGVLLYDNNSTPVVMPSHHIINVPSAAQLQANWNWRFGLALRFKESAAHNLSKGWNELAMFMLHQAVEHACIALIQIYTGYRAATHKLTNLLALVENFAVDVFPRSRQDEREHFAVLERAYIDSRYHDDYALPTDTINTLAAQVNAFLQRAEHRCQEKLEASAKHDAEDVRMRHVALFESICLDTFAHVVLQKGEAESIRIEATTALARAIQTYVNGTRLWVSTNVEGFDRWPEATVYITYVQLNGLVVHRAASVTCREPVEGAWLGIVQNSRSRMELDVQVSTLDVTLTKTGHVTLRGSAEEARIHHHGNGQFTGCALDASVAKVTILRSGSVAIYAEDELVADIRGSGDVLYGGAPRLRALSVIEPGNLTRYPLCAVEQ